MVKEFDPSPNQPWARKDPLMTLMPNKFQSVQLIQLEPLEMSALSILHKLIFFGVFFNVIQIENALTGLK